MIKTSFNKNSIKEYISNNRAFVIILTIGFIIRLICAYFMNSAEAIHADEAMLILNARSLVDNGTDILGTSYPVYFATWLWGGQSSFATYLAALSIKIFGYSVIASRLPIFIFSILGLVALWKLTQELFHNEKISNFTLLMAALSPWHIMQSVWILDCNFFPHLFIIATYFLIKGANGIKRSRNYIISMIFFALCLHSYIASFLIVPIFMIVMLIILIKNKLISWKQIVICFATFVATLLPLIIFGLVNFDIIPEFTVFNISFFKMENYGRDNSLIFGYMSSFTTFLNVLTNNILVFIKYIFAYRSNVTPTSLAFFGHSNIFGPILSLIGVILFFKNIKKLKNNAVLNGFVISVIITLSFFIVVSIGQDSAEYRYGFIIYVLFVLQGYVLYWMTTNIKKINVTKIVSCLLAATTFVFIFFYSVYCSAINNNFLYGKPLEASISQIDRTSNERVVFVNSKFGNLNERVAVFLRFYEYENIDEFVSLKYDLKTRNACENNFTVVEENGDELNINVKNDGTWVYRTINTNDELVEDIYIIIDDKVVSDLISFCPNISEYEIITNQYCSILRRE